jgi:hypothetical protein
VLDLDPHTRLVLQRPWTILKGGIRPLITESGWVISEEKLGRKKAHGSYAQNEMKQ